MDEARRRKEPTKSSRASDFSVNLSCQRLPAVAVIALYGKWLGRRKAIKPVAMAPVGALFVRLSAQGKVNG
jgi:hypothetical protein